MYSKVRFWRWYRTIPIVALAVVCALCFGLRSVPSGIVPGMGYPVKYKDAIVESSNRHGVDPRLTCAIIKCESNWNEKAQSAAGATGLMQVMRETAGILSASAVSSDYDPDNLTDPETNIEFGAAYLGDLRQMLSSESGEAPDEAVIAAYNAGPGTVATWLSGGGSLEDAITYPETAAYLMRVSDAYKHYKEMYDVDLSEIK